MSNVLLQTLSYAVMPEDDGSGSTQANDFYNYLAATFPGSIDKWIAYASESEFEDVIGEGDYSRESVEDRADAIGFAAGVVFSSGTPDWQYTVSVGKREGVGGRGAWRRRRVMASSNMFSVGGESKLTPRVL